MNKIDGMVDIMKRLSVIFVLLVFLSSAIAIPAHLKKGSEPAPELSPFKEEHDTALISAPDLSPFKEEHDTPLFSAPDLPLFTEEHDTAPISASDVRTAGMECEDSRSAQQYRDNNNSGGGWLQTTDNDFNENTLTGVTITGHGTDADVNLTVVDDEGWLEVQPDTNPVARYGHRMVYDSMKKKVVLFGGRLNTGVACSETWIYDVRHNTWTQVHPPSTPAARYLHGMAYDSTNNKIVMFGGYWVAAETWVYDIETNLWAQQYPEVSPPRLYGLSMTYDSINDKVVLFGGITHSGGWKLTNQTWLYDVAENTWTKAEPSASPPARYLHDMTFDPINNRIVLFGGHNGAAMGDTWTYNVANDRWTEIHPDTPPLARYYPSLIFDSDVNSILLYGGYPYDYHTWSYDTLTRSWTRRIYQDPPYRRYATGLAHDSYNKKTVMFGGYGGYMDDTWIYDHSRYPTSGTMTSPLITLPEGHVWDRLHMDKSEKQGAYLNVSIINALTSTPVLGFERISAGGFDVSPLNDAGVSSIRLKASFKGSSDLTPILHSWGIQWKKEGSWHQDFIGDHDINGYGSPDNRTSAFWSFDEGYGQIIGDSSSNNIEGLLGGGDNVEPGDPSWVGGKIGSALRFDGLDDYVRIPEDKMEPLRPNNELTLETWFRIDSYEETSAILGGRANGDYALQVLRNGTLLALLSTIDLEPDQYNELYSRSTIMPGVWYHVALVFDKPDISLYVNGMKECSKERNFPIRHSSNVPLFIGAEVGSAFYPYEPTNFFSGVIDGIHISAAAIDGDVIFRNARGGLSVENGAAQLLPNAPIVTQDTVFQYSFKEINSTIIRDASPNQVQGTLRGNRKVATGLFGTALQFDGTSPFIRVRDSFQTHLENATYEFWIKCFSHIQQGILFSEDLPAGGINEQGFIDASGHVHYILNDIHDVTSTGTLPMNEWVHLAFVRSGSTARIYINGKDEGSGSYSGFDPNDKRPLFLGGNSTLGGSFDGLMDEVILYRKDFSPEVIMSHSNLFHARTFFRTEDVILPTASSRNLRGMPEYSWNTFGMECDLVENSALNVSVHDNATGEVLFRIIPNSSSIMTDLSKINVLDYPAVYVQAEILSDGMRSSKILSWGVSWNPIESPSLTEDMPEQVHTNEDLVGASLADMNEHFHDLYADISPSEYGVEYLSEPFNITLSFNNFTLFVENLGENWTGSATVIINCTNIYGRTTSSNPFLLVVLNVDDAPVWATSPAAIEIDEDDNVTFENFLSPHVFDMENDDHEFRAVCDNDNISLFLGEHGTLTIAGRADYFGSGNITATVFESEEPTLFSNISFPVTVRAINDLPEVVLLAPRNLTVQTSRDLDFTWEVRDVDSPVENISYDLHLSKAFPPMVYLSDLTNTSASLNDLEDDSTYFWKVIPHDGVEKGSCLNDTWSFHVNTTILYPELDLDAPLTGTILNDTTVNLSWKSRNPTGETLMYHVHLGTSAENMTEVGVTEETWMVLPDLKDNSTYYWQVIPVAGSIKGPCNSGIWNFHINTSFEAIYNLSIEFDRKYINITQGENATLNITITNLGNVPVMVEVKSDGLPSLYMGIDEIVFIPIGGTVVISSGLSNTLILQPNVYILLIRITSAGGEEEREIPITIKSSSPEDPEGETVKASSIMDEYWLWMVVGALILITIGSIMIVIRKRRAYRRELEEREIEELELLEAEIVRPGDDQLPPPPPMEPHQALPQYAGQTGYYRRENAPQLAQQPYDPAAGGQEWKQLPPGEATMPGEEQLPVPPPPSEAQLSVPTPSVTLPDMMREPQPSQIMKMLPPAPPSGIQVPRIHMPVRGRVPGRTVPQPGAGSTAMPPGGSPPTSTGSSPPTSSVSSSPTPVVSSPPTSSVGSPSTPAVGSPTTPSGSSPTASKVGSSPTPPVQEYIPPAATAAPTKAVKKEPVSKKVGTSAPPVKKKAPPPSSGGTPAGTPSGEDSALDALSRLLNDMPTTLDEKKKDDKPPAPPG